MIVEPPLGKLVTLTAVWWGKDMPAPVPGNWIGTEKGRTSYEVVEVRPRRTTGYVLRCRRWPRGKEAESARLARWFVWTWAARDPQRKAATA